MTLPAHLRLRGSVVAVLAVALSIGMLAGPATAAAPVYLNVDGNCDNPPTSSRTIDQSLNDDPFVVIDYGRSRLEEFNAKSWQLVNLDTGLVEFVAFGPGALAEYCLTGTFQTYLLNDDTSGPVLGNQLQLARYRLVVSDTVNGAYKYLRFSVVP